MLRVMGCLHRSIANPSEAEICFNRSLELGRSQGSRAWELRTAIDLAALWAVQKRTHLADAHQMTKNVLNELEKRLEIIRGVRSHYELAGQAPPDEVTRAVEAVRTFARKLCSSALMQTHKPCACVARQSSIRSAR